MKKNKSLVKFDMADIEQLSSEKEMSEVLGGNVIKAILKALGLAKDGGTTNDGCNNCNC